MERLKSAVEDQLIKNLIFQGGSVKGTAYIGAIAGLEKRGILSGIEHVGGTSAGAITALLVALNYSSEELKNTLAERDLSSFLDKDHLWLSKKNLTNWDNAGSSQKSSTVSGVILELNSVNLGLYPGEDIRTWLDSLIRAKSKNRIKHCTFKEFRDEGFKDLHVVGYNLSRSETTVFNYKTTPNMIVSDAVRISISIPVIFCPHQVFEKVDGERQRVKTVDVENDGNVDEKSVDKNMYDADIWIDGGITDNYPEILLQNKPFLDNTTIGFYLTKNVNPENPTCQNPHRPKKISGTRDYLATVFQAALYGNQQQNRHQTCQERCPNLITIYIHSCDIGSLEFNLSVEQKNQLIKSGWDSVEKAFSGTDDCPIRLEDQPATPEKSCNIV